MPPFCLGIPRGGASRPQQIDNRGIYLSLCLGIDIVRDQIPGKLGSPEVHNRPYHAFEKVMKKEKITKGVIWHVKNPRWRNLIKNSRGCDPC